VKKILVLVAVVMASLAFSSSAFADSLKCAHGSQCGSGAFQPPGNTGSGTLPFTGFGLAGIATVGGVLLVSGLMLQRASRHRR
jgi:hypothetical protein